MISTSASLGFIYALITIVLLLNEWNELPIYRYLFIVLLVSSKYTHDIKHSQWCASLQYAYMAIFQLGLGPISLFIAAELVPSAARTFTQATGTAVSLLLSSKFKTPNVENTFCSAALTLIFPPLFNKAGPSLFILFAFFMGFICIFALAYQPETRNRPVDEIVEEYNKFSWLDWSRVTSCFRKKNRVYGLRGH